MLFHIAAIVAFTIVVEQAFCATLPHQDYGKSSPRRKRQAGVAVMNKGGKAAVYSLNEEQGKQLADNLLGDISGRIRDSLSNTQMLGQNMQNQFTNNLQKQLSNAFGNFGGGDGMFGMGGISQAMSNLQNNIFAGVQNTLNANQNRISDSIKTAAKNGNLKVASAVSNGPSVSVASVGDDDGESYAMGSKPRTAGTKKNSKSSR